MNDLKFLQKTIKLLQKNGLQVWIFGGWAEELLGVIEPRQHKDIDLLYPASDFDKVDSFLIKYPNIVEITAKHLNHKRAFEIEGIMIELFLVQKQDQQLLTNFWGRKRYYWPDDTFDLKAGFFKTASPSALSAYRKNHNELLS